LSDLYKADAVQIAGEVIVDPGDPPTAGDQEFERDLSGLPPDAIRRVRLERERLVAEFDRARERMEEEARQRVAAALAEARTQAEAILVEARLQAETVVSEAHRDGERIRVEAVATGRAEGESQVGAEMSGAIDDLRRRIGEILDESRAAFLEFVDGAESEVLSLTTAIARRVIEAELTYAADALPGMIAQSLSRLRDTRRLRVRVSPGDLGRATELRDELIAKLGTIEGVEIVADPQVDGGAVIETEMGTVDASLSGQLGEIEDAIEAASEGNGSWR